MTRQSQRTRPGKSKPIREGQVDEVEGEVGVEVVVLEEEEAGVGEEVSSRYLQRTCTIKGTRGYIHISSCVGGSIREDFEQSDTR